MQTLFSFFNSVGDGYFIGGFGLRRRRNQPLLNILFCLYLVIDEHGHLKIYLPKKLLECLPKCTSLPKERHRWNTNEVRLYRTSSCLVASVHEKMFLFSALFWLPGYNLSVWHVPLGLLYLTPLFLLIGLYKMDFVHILWNYVFLFSGKEALNLHFFFLIPAPASFFMFPEL